MIFAFVGEKTAREKARAFIDGLLKKKPNATLVRLSGDAWQTDDVRGLAQAQSLFAGNSVVRLDGFLATRESADQLEPLLASLAESSNIFVFVEDKLLAADKKLLESLAKEVKEYSDKELPPTAYRLPASFNIYALSDALAEKKRRELWLIFHEALMSGISPEMIFWKFVWQVRVLLAAREGKEGMKAIGSSVEPTRALGKGCDWTRETLLLLSQTLVELYHDFEKFRGVPDLEFALERVILSL